MRTYPRNSPEAAARIVALVLVADGHVCRSEVEAVSDEALARELGLPAGRFGGVVHGLCEDLLMGAHAGGTMLSALDDRSLELLMDEVDDPALQRAVLRLANQAAAADRHLADGERHVLDLARRYWSHDAFA